MTAVIESNVEDIVGKVFGFFFCFSDFFEQIFRNTILATKMDNADFVFDGFFEVGVNKGGVETHEIVNFGF